MQETGFSSSIVYYEITLYIFWFRCSSVPITKMKIPVFRCWVKPCFQKLIWNCFFSLGQWFLAFFPFSTLFYVQFNEQDLSRKRLIFEEDDFFGGSVFGKFFSHFLGWSSFLQPKSCQLCTRIYLLPIKKKLTPYKEIDLLV